MKRILIVLLSILLLMGFTGILIPGEIPNASAGPAPETRGETRTVLVEDFTATWCGPCKTAAAALKQLEAEVGKANLVIVGEHMSDNLETTETAARGSAYGVSAFPTVWFDGTIEQVGAGSNAYDVYKGHYNTRRNDPSPLKMESGGTIDGSNANMEVQIEKTGTMSGNVNVRFFLMEDNVLEGGERFDHVVRDIMEESVSSSAFPVLKQKQFNIDSSWDKTKLHGAIFVQEGTNGKVHQAIHEDFDGPLNQPPEVSSGAQTEISTNEDIPITIDLRQFYIDNEGDSLTFTFDTADNVDMELTTTNDLKITPNANWNGEVQITFYATDGPYHNPVPHTVKLTVLPVNDAPEAISDNLDIKMTEDSSNQDINLNNVFSDIDGDSLTYTVTGNFNLGVTISGDGTVFIDSTGEFHGSEILTFIATDPSGATGTKDVTVTIKSQNDQPLIKKDISDITMDEDTIDNSLDLSEIFFDPDGDTLYYTFERSSNINIDIEPSGIVEITPRKNWYGTETVTFKATDQFSPNVHTTAKVTVRAVNDAPEPSFVTEVVAFQDEETTRVFEATDIENDFITFELNIRSVVQGLVEGENYNFNQDTGELTITPTNAMVGEYTIKLVAKDDGSPSAKSDPMEFKLVISNVNDKPTNLKILQPTAGMVFSEDDSIILHGQADDPDLLIPNTEESLQYTWYTDKQNYAIGNGAQTTVILPPGEHVIKMKVYDSSNAYAEQTVTITVTSNTPETPAGGGSSTTDLESGGWTFKNTLWWIIAAIIIVIVVVLLITLNFMHKKKPALTPEEEQLQNYYNQMADQGMMGTGMEYGYPSDMYGTGAQMPYPQQPMYPQQSFVTPTQTFSQPTSGVSPVPQPSVQPSPAPLQPNPPEVPQLPPADLPHMPTPSNPIKTSQGEIHGITKPVGQQGHQTGQQPKDWNWNY